MDVEIPNLPGSLRLNSDLIAPALRERGSGDGCYRFATIMG
jgi:hypothetical protein